MKTLLLTVDSANLASPASVEAIAAAAAIVRDGGTVAFPTETVYGLGANALDEDAVRRIFLAKQRPQWDPLIVHIADPQMLLRVADELPQVQQHRAHILMQSFWPGPLTLLLPRARAVPPLVTADRPRVGVRMPSHPVALALIRAAGLPIAAPSANSFGRTSPTSAAHVLQDLDGRIDAILDGGATTLGLESTVVDACEDPLLIYRPGVVTVDQIRALAGQAEIYREQPSQSNMNPESLPSPGVGLRHYAPRARLILIEEEGDALRQQFSAALSQALSSGEAVGLMLPEDFPAGGANPDLVYRWGSWTSAEELASRLFAGLRQLDASGATLILCPLPAAQGIGIAIRDRLMKAARTE